MSDTEIFARSTATLIFGAILIGIAVLVVRLYVREATRQRRKALLWDLAATILTGPWSFPLALAAMLATMGALALVVGFYFIATSGNPPLPGTDRTEELLPRETAMNIAFGYARDAFLTNAGRNPEAAQMRVSEERYEPEDRAWHFVIVTNDGECMIDVAVMEGGETESAGGGGCR